MVPTPEQAPSVLLRVLQHGRSKYAAVSDQPTEDLLLRVNEAASWCASRTREEAIGGCLRPWDIAPRQLPENRWDAVDDVALMRRQQLAAVDALGVSTEQPGRLLVYFPDGNLADGAASAESRDFFDYNNVPPWGTWIGYFDDRIEDPNRSKYLIAWVPAALVEYAHAGIAVNPEECILWLGNTQVAVRPILELLLTERPGLPGQTPAATR